MDVDAHTRLFALTYALQQNKRAAAAAAAPTTVTTAEVLRIGLGCSKSTLWSTDIESYSNCEFSSAMLWANNPVEDYSQVIIGQNAAFVGIYDGHCGSEAANYANTFLFDHLIRISGERGSTMSLDIIKEAISETEKGFIEFVRLSLETNPEIVRVGTCCTVGVIWKETLYVANLGDSRAVLGTTSKDPRAVILANIYGRRTDTLVGLQLAREDRDANIRHLCKCIGNAYVKYPEEFDRGRDNPKTIEINLELSHDKFVIFASRGLWEFLSNQEAVNIVHNNPRPGIAKRLIKSALLVAAKRRNVTYKEIKTRDDRTERKIHDDITVVVVFFKHTAGQPSFRSLDMDTSTTNNVRPSNSTKLKTN